MIRSGSVSYYGIWVIKLLLKSIFDIGHFCHHYSPSKFMFSILIISSGIIVNSYPISYKDPVYQALFIFAINYLSYAKVVFLFDGYTLTTKSGGLFGSTTYSYCWTC